MTAPQQQTSIKDLPDDQKRALVAEFNALADDGSGQRKRWIEEHGFRPGTFYAVRRGTMAAAAAKPKKQHKSTQPVSVRASRATVGVVTPELIAEYEAHDDPDVSRKTWLAKRGLTYSKIYEYRKAHQAAGAARTRKPASQLFVGPATPTPMTVDDAIAALRVKLDVMRDMIGDLERMRASWAGPQSM